MPPVVTAGDCLLWNAGAEGMHLWIVITNPDQTDGKVVMVMVVSERPHTDKTLVLGAGSHPFIRRNSNLDFGGAKPFPASKIAKAIAEGNAHPQTPVSATILADVQNAVLTSSRTPHFISDYCRPTFTAANSSGPNDAPED